MYLKVYLQWIRKALCLEDKRKTKGEFKENKLRLAEIQDEIRREIIEDSYSKNETESDAPSVVTKAMIQLGELDKLKAHRHESVWTYCTY